MNRLVIIGNGFDLAHGLKTRYEDFINWYWDQRRDMLCLEHSNISEDILCKWGPHGQVLGRIPSGNPITVLRTCCQGKECENYNKVADNTCV